MAEKLIILAVMVAVALSVSALEWQQCEPLSTKINSVRIESCDPERSTPERCALKLYERHLVEIDYIQPKLMDVPVIRHELGDHRFDHEDFVGCLFDLECPGAVGQEQHLRKSTLTDNPMNKSKELPLRITIRQNGSSVDEPDLCVDIPVRLWIKLY